ncbi:M1 family metallopeptidase [Portibacter lacus]|uniref:Aminopeptidase n=1 Tax=Portibacter lacus TaxID=1099794 RepID=A0AA37SQS3_9BACT|nr:M1 family metallopeptidase [Portibacter lacus]GLR19141.1 aminopeptidase [Portibacter lacus]
MKKIFYFLTLSLFALNINAQKEWEGKFEQLGTNLPTPNEYRTGSGAPGESYWQQKVDYDMEITLDDAKQTITGSEKIHYHNNSPDQLNYLWIQLDQNMRNKNSNTYKTMAVGGAKENDTIPAKIFSQYMDTPDLERGFNIVSVTDDKGNKLPYIINQTMMRIDVPQPIKSGGEFKFRISWNYNINDRMSEGGRSGYEYFPKDDNYLYTIAQFFPRLAVYDDANGWQNKQFLGRGEFALEFGDYKVAITVPADHVVASTGTLQNPKDVLSAEHLKRFEMAKKSFDKPVIIVTEDEAIENEKTKDSKNKTWVFDAKMVRDFAFASSRKFIWDAQAVQLENSAPLAMSYYPKEGNPLWEEESTKAVVATLKTYSKFTIEYPYPKAISVHAASIGMEYPMICFNFGRPNEDGTVSDRTKYGMIGVIIHEVGHNFFPMIINSDERQWTWMDEGLNTFVQYLTEQEQYVDFPSRRGPAANITPYMSMPKDQIRPIMTNSEQIKQFGWNAYAKPATALNILRETIMGKELFDAAFKEYATRWAFKRPQPADLFRTLEDASAVDLDWFWKGWFYTVDHVDVEIEDVRWMKIGAKPQMASVDKTPVEETSKKKKKKKKKKSKVEEVVEMPKEKKEAEAATDFSKGPKPFVLAETDARMYGEYRNKVDDSKIIAEASKKNFYSIKFANKGGLVTPIILEFTFKDGSKTIERIPAEVWRMDEESITKTFSFEKEVTNIVLDPLKETADTNTENNVFPKVEAKSKFDKLNGKA